MHVVTTQDSRSVTECPSGPAQVPHLCFLASPSCISGEGSGFPKGSQDANTKGETDMAQPRTLQMSTTLDSSKDLYEVQGSCSGDACGAWAGMG